MLISLYDLLHAGQNGEDLRELTVEGTTFDPTTGGVGSLTSLDRNLEVGLRHCSLFHDVWFLLPRPCALS